MDEDIKKIVKFRETLEKHNLHTEENADKIAKYLTDSKKDNISLNKFAQEFNIPIEDAEIILHVIYKGIEFKGQLVDKDKVKK